MNILDSELVVNLLKKLGYQFVDNIDNANIVLYNTCSVRNLSEQKILSRLGILKKRKDSGKKIKVGILGCMAERTKINMLSKNKLVNFLIGPNNLHQVPRFLANIKFNHVYFLIKVPQLIFYAYTHL